MHVQAGLDYRLWRKLWYVGGDDPLDSSRFTFFQASNPKTLRRPQLAEQMCVNSRRISKHADH